MFNLVITSSPPSLHALRIFYRLFQHVSRSRHPPNYYHSCLNYIHCLSAILLLRICNICLPSEGKVKKEGKHGGEGRAAYCWPLYLAHATLVWACTLRHPPHTRACRTTAYVQTFRATRLAGRRPPLCAVVIPTRRHCAGAARRQAGYRAKAT